MERGINGMGYRSDFVRAFGELFSSDEVRCHHEGHGVEKMEFDEESENVIIHWIGGKMCKVNVAGDSLSAIAYDIIKNGLW